LFRWILHEAWIDLLELALVAALGVSCAYWTWIAISPRVPAAPTLMPGAEVAKQGVLATRHLFGEAQEGGGTAAGRARAAAEFALLGVFSGRGPATGRAILARQGSRPAIVAAGESIADGVKLQEVYPDHVIVLRNGSPERIDLERSVSRAAPLLGPARVPLRK
jgi:general secretion pathway protein C